MRQAKSLIGAHVINTADSNGCLVQPLLMSREASGDLIVLPQLLLLPLLLLPPLLYC